MSGEFVGEKYKTAATSLADVWRRGLEQLMRDAIQHPYILLVVLLESLPYFFEQVAHVLLPLLRFGCAGGWLASNEKNVPIPGRKPGNRRRPFAYERAPTHDA